MSIGCCSSSPRWKDTAKLEEADDVFLTLTFVKVGSAWSSPPRLARIALHSEPQSSSSKSSLFTPALSPCSSLFVTGGALQGYQDHGGVFFSTPLMTRPFSEPLFQSLPSPASLLLGPGLELLPCVGQGYALESIELGLLPVKPQVVKHLGARGFYFLFHQTNVFIRLTPRL